MKTRSRARATVSVPESSLKFSLINALLLAVWGVAHEPRPSAAADPHADDPDAPPTSAP